MEQRGALAAPHSSFSGRESKRVPEERGFGWGGRSGWWVSSPSRSSLGLPPQVPACHPGATLSPQTQRSHL